MADNVVDRFVVEIGLSSEEFVGAIFTLIEKNKELIESLKSVEDSSKKVEKSNAELSDSHKKTRNELEKLGNVVGGLKKGFVGLFTTFMVQTGMQKFINEAQKANNELFFLEKNTGLSAVKIKSWQVVAGMSGGSAEGMASSIKNLSKTMTNFVTMGDTSMLPYFNALGVSMVDSQGKLRQIDDVLLDLSDSLSSMDRQQAYNIASSMGLDEGTINLLLRGRKEVENLLKEQDKLYKSDKSQLETSRKLAEAQAKMNANWERLSLMIGNSLIPVFSKIVKKVDDFLMFMQRHDKEVIFLFQTLALMGTALVIPMLLKMGAAALVAMAPFAPFILTVGALSAAFLLLYDDYKTWADGGKSLFDWKNFGKSIKKVSDFVDHLTKKIKELVNVIKKNLQPIIEDIDKTSELIDKGDYKGAALSMLKGGNNVLSTINGVFYSSVEQAAEGIGWDWLANKSREFRKQAKEWSDYYDGKIGKSLDPNYNSDTKSYKNPNHGDEGSKNGFTAGAIKGLTNDETEKLVETLIGRESGGQLDVVNSAGYTGIYQFGAEALADVGYIDKQKLEDSEFYKKQKKGNFSSRLHKEFLENPDNWLIGDLEHFKSSKYDQDKAFKTLVELNLERTAESHGGNKMIMFGAAMAAHLVGANRANKWYLQGIDSHDGNGTKASDYAKAGENAFKSLQNQWTNNALISLINGLNKTHVNANLSPLYFSNLMMPRASNGENIHNKSVAITLNGGVHVNSSASTIEGTMSDGANAFKNRFSGLVTGLT